MQSVLSRIWTRVAVSIDLFIIANNVLININQ